MNKNKIISQPSHDSTTNNEQKTIVTLALLSVVRRNVSLRPPSRLIIHYSLRRSFGGRCEPISIREQLPGGQTIASAQGEEKPLNMRETRINSNGESGIRTHVALAHEPVFETGAFSRSAISPRPAIFQPAMDLIIMRPSCCKGKRLPHFIANG